MTVTDYEWQEKPRSVNIKACFLCVSMEISFLNEQLQESKPKGAIVDVTVESSGFQINKIIYVYFHCEDIEQAPF